MKHIRLKIGIAFWCLALVAIAAVPVFLSENSWVNSFSRVYNYVVEDRQQVTVNFDQLLWIKQGDPIYTKTEYGWKRIGQVASDQYDDDGIFRQTKSIKISLFGDAPPITQNCTLTLHETPSSFEWALQRLLPDEKRKEIIADLKSTFEIHQKDIIESFTPVLMETLGEIGQVLQEDLKNALAANREKLAKIAARYQEGFVEKRLIPLLKDEIWPIVEKRTQPVFNEVGSEIWQKASLWRFGWRLAYDKFPLTNSNLTEQEWNRFVKNDALPIVENHADDFYRLARDIMREIAENTEVKQAGKEGIQQLLKDEEIKALISETLWKILFENDRLKQVIRQNLSNEKTIQVVRDTSAKFENKIREIGDELFGTFELGITKEFAGVLRKEILRRDERWFVLRYAETEVEDPLAIATEINGSFRIDATDRPEFVRYRNDK